MIAAHTDLAVVGEAKNGGNALELVATLHLDIILMQALMPVVNGVAATRRIRAACPTVQGVLVPSFFTDDGVEGGRADATGYLRPDADAEQFVLTIRAAHRGTARHPPFPAQAYRYTGFHAATSCDTPHVVPSEPLRCFKAALSSRAHGRKVHEETRSTPHTMTAQRSPRRIL